ncbi:MAG: DUF2156 domain-containing protein [Desulfuromonadaceae bacterium]|nr:DUF2156 domain-containing protein [Desulfuromonadaceae bacterium]MDD5106366.1 DUF2156 domain-containing protein [Desulfuromonadaceae bacterium]
MEIPQYPASKPIECTDKQFLDQLFTALQPRVSELTFAGLYLFRKAHNYRLSLVGDALIVHGTRYDGASYFLPPLGGDVAAALTVMFGQGAQLYGADDRFAAEYLSHSAGRLVELRDSFDYLYLREELATLPGSRFHKKKNRINYFTNRHSSTTVLFSSEYAGGCQRLLDKWVQNSGSDATRSLLLEIEAASEALHSAGELGLEGVVVLIDGTVAAFALGERLNRDTAVCHFEKADPFCEGLYQLVNREFATRLFTDCTYLNREQDLGEMGMRNAKLSYHPVELVKKYLCKGSYS